MLSTNPMKNTEPVLTCYGSSATNIQPAALRLRRMCMYLLLFRKVPAVYLFSAGKYKSR
jgi:hypothetical protein